MGKFKFSNQKWAMWYFFLQEKKRENDKHSYQVFVHYVKYISTSSNFYNTKHM